MIATATATATGTGATGIAAAAALARPDTAPAATTRLTPTPPAGTTVSANARTRTLAVSAVTTVAGVIHIQGAIVPGTATMTVDIDGTATGISRTADGDVEMVADLVAAKGGSRILPQERSVKVPRT